MPLVSKSRLLSHTPHTSVNGDMNIPSAGEVGNIIAGNGPVSAELGELHLMLVMWFLITFKTQPMSLLSDIALGATDLAIFLFLGRKIGF